MSFRIFGFAGGRYASLKAFCQQVLKTMETPTLISMVAGERAYINYCREIITADEHYRKKFDSFCRENVIDPDEIRTRVRLAAIALGICKLEDFYGILGVPPSADEAAIKQAYRKKAQMLHPDKCNGAKRTSDEFIELHTAYAHLIDSSLRKAYDEARQSARCWIEGDKISVPATRRRHAGRFIVWMCALTGGMLLIAYAFDVYQSPSSFPGPQQSHDGRFETADDAAEKVYPNTATTGENAKPKTGQRKVSHVHTIMKATSDSVSTPITKVKSAVFTSETKKASADKAVKACLNGPAIKPASTKIAKPGGNKKNPRLDNRGMVSKTAKADVPKKVVGPISANAGSDIGAISDAPKYPAPGTIPSEEKMDAQTIYLLQKQRVLTFLRKFTKTYEQKDLEQFRTFFTISALEQGRPFESLLPTYQQTFNSVKALRYIIELRSVSLDRGGKTITIEGDFTTRYQLPDKHWGRCVGLIRMELLDAPEGLLVSRMDYEVDIKER